MGILFLRFLKMNLKRRPPTLHAIFPVRHVTRRFLRVFPDMDEGLPKPQRSLPSKIVSDEIEFNHHQHDRGAKDGTKPQAQHARHAFDEQ